jgi:signal transduction histidine kinase
MTVRAAPAEVTWSGRRGPLTAEIVVLVALVVVDTVFGVRAATRPDPLTEVVVAIAPAAGPVIAVLAVLRRRFDDRILLLGAASVGLSLLATGLTAVANALGELARPQPAATEALALALLVGAGCHRLAPRPAGALALAAGLAMVGGPIVRFGLNFPAALFAVGTALMWGGGVAVGLILRDADTRKVAELTELRSAERLALARELHDLVAHHITGMVVRAQAATRMAQRAGHAESGEIFTEFELAGADALAAIRRLVRVLRTEEGELLSAPANLLDAVRDATDGASVAGAGTLAVTLSPGLAELSTNPETASTVHRILLEALTNVRRHAPAAASVDVAVRAEPEAGQGWLVVEVANDAARPVNRKSAGYGLIGMAERVTALGGSLHAGPEDGHRWLVRARLPLHQPDGGAATENAHERAHEGRPEERR